MITLVKFVSRLNMRLINKGRIAQYYLYKVLAIWRNNWCGCLSGLTHQKYRHMYRVNYKWRDLVMPIEEDKHRKPIYILVGRSWEKVCLFYFGVHI